MCGFGFKYNLSGLGCPASWYVVVLSGASEQERKQPRPRGWSRNRNPNSALNQAVWTEPQQIPSQPHVPAGYESTCTDTTPQSPQSHLCGGFKNKKKKNHNDSNLSNNCRDSETTKSTCNGNVAVKALRTVEIALVLARVIAMAIILLMEILQVTVIHGNSNNNCNCQVLVAVWRWREQLHWY